MPAIQRIILTLLPLLASVTAHKEPKTPQEIEVQRALQAAAYHVRLVPDLDVAIFTKTTYSAHRPLQNSLHLGNDHGHRRFWLDDRLYQDMKNSSHRGPMLMG